jgi:tRNA G37 N-methylase Trm5
VEVKPVSLQYLKEAVTNNDNEKLIRYVRLHLGDGNEATGRNEIDKAWVEALKLLLDVPPTDRKFILDTVNNHTPATLAHLYFHLHFYFVQRSGTWIHDGTL